MKLSKTAIEKLVKVADTIDLMGLNGEVTSIDHIVSIEKQRDLVEKIRKGLQSYLGSGIYWNERGNIFKFEFCRYREPRIDYNTKNIRGVAFYIKPPTNKIILYEAFDVPLDNRYYWIRGHLTKNEIKDLLKMKFGGLNPKPFSEPGAYEASISTIN